MMSSIRNAIFTGKAMSGQVPAHATIWSQTPAGRPAAAPAQIGAHGATVLSQTTALPVGRIACRLDPDGKGFGPFA